jgi:signal transduction histidine kinase
MERTASGAVHEMQALLLELRPIALEEAGLVPALQELCRAYRERLGVDVQADLADPIELAPPVEHAVLRVAQEALANALKHSDAGQVRLELRAEDGQVAVSVTDDGLGFDPDGDGSTRAGLGLRLMRERVEELGGSIRVDSATGRGTSVRVLIPKGET